MSGSEERPSPAHGGGAGSGFRVLFVCTGNTCRSPMAEAIGRAEAERRGWEEVEVGSAGTFALGGEPAAEAGRIVALRHGLDLAGHRARTLVPELVERADLVLGMTPSHVAVARELAPGARVELLTRFLPREHEAHDAPVPDPVGGSLERYEETFRLLCEAVRGIFDILGEARSGA